MPCPKCRKFIRARAILKKNNSCNSWHWSTRCHWEPCLANFEFPERKMSNPFQSNMLASDSLNTNECACPWMIGIKPARCIYIVLKQWHSQILEVPLIAWNPRLFLQLAVSCPTKLFLLSLVEWQWHSLRSTSWDLQGRPPRVWYVSRSPGIDFGTSVPSCGVSTARKLWQRNEPSCASK